MSQDAAERIEAALARIEAAASARAYSTARLARRHQLLRDRVQQAITALDDVISHADSGEEQD